MNTSTLRPICFMVMPFGKKKTDIPATVGPGEIDFDLLWDKALRPAIETLGYEAVRADQDVGALIVHEMLERLYFADLVLADMTIPNGNVYYEVGIRHACKQVGCVLLAADWSRQLFDVAQNRTVRYPLTVGNVDDAAAKAIQDAIVPRIENMKGGDSPMFQVLPGFPGKVSPTRASVMRKHLADLAAFQSRISAVRATPSAERPAALAQLLSSAPTPPVPAVVHSLLNLCHDLGAWQELLDLRDKLPPELAAEPRTIELASLAQSKLGNTLASIGTLQQLIASHGATSEREGLLGGRYKALWMNATGGDRARFLNEAIRHYEAGMMLDLNDYYPSCNLPRLYRERGLPDDLVKARSVAEVVYFACHRSIQAGTAAEWARHSLLAVAFDAADVSTARSLYAQVVAEGANGWKLDILLKDLGISIAQVSDPATRAELTAIFEQLKKLDQP